VLHQQLAATFEQFGERRRPSGASKTQFLSMRTHGSARRSRAIWSRRRVRSFSRASSALRSATHSSLVTTRWFSLLG
jgi:hypothetical protein